ncbi:MAG: thiamine pyrophosphate-dependent enzyme [Thermoplasmata archaeon]
MNRVDALREIAATPALRVCNLGYPSRELFHVRDDPTTFYMLGSMGLASSVGLGLALVQSRRVVAIDGDGSVLMNLGTLSTIAHFAPAHFTLVILDNGTHGSTGDQPTHSSLGTDLARVASACGVARVRSVDTPQGLRATLDESGGSVIVARIEPGNADVPPVPLTGPHLRDRFQNAVGAIP